MGVGQFGIVESIGTCRNGITWVQVAMENGYEYLSVNADGLALPGAKPRSTKKAKPKANDAGGSDAGPRVSTNSWGLWIFLAVVAVVALVCGYQYWGTIV